MPAALPPQRARIAVLLSGTGSLCAALLAATDDPDYPATVVAVGADREAAGLEHARRRGLPTFVCAVSDHPDRGAWDRALAAELAAFDPDLVVSAGFMKIVGPAVLDAADDPAFPAEVVAVGSDREAPGLEHARRRGLPTFVTRLGDHPDRAAWDRALAAELAAHEPDLVVSAGFMKLVGPAVLDAFGGRLINTHPALLPAFPGAHAVRDALAAGVEVTGSTVHLVDAGIDTGPVLAQREVRVLPDDDEARLHERIKTAERELLVETVAALVAAPHLTRENTR